MICFTICVVDCEPLLFHMDEQSIGLQEVEAVRLSTYKAPEGGKIISTTHRPPLPPRKYSW